MFSAIPDLGICNQVITIDPEILHYNLQFSGQRIKYESTGQSTRKLNDRHRPLADILI